MRLCRNGERSDLYVPAVGADKFRGKWLAKGDQLCLDEGA